MRQQRNEPRRTGLDRKCDPRAPRPELTAEQRTLANEHVRLAYGLARPFREACPAEAEDFDGAALLALCQAAEAFDKGKGVRFVTFAQKRILGALKNHAERAERRGLVARRGLKGIPSVSPIRAEPVAQAAEPYGDEGDQDGGEDRFEARIAGLPDEERAVCRALFGEGLSLGEAGAKLGMDRQRVFRCRNRALKILHAAAG